MELTFQGGPEVLRLKIDRINKTLEIASSKTQYRYLRQPFWKLFGDKAGDEEEARREQAEMELSSDEDFKKRLEKDMAKQGYFLVKKG